MYITEFQVFVLLIIISVVIYAVKRFISEDEDRNYRDYRDRDEYVPPEKLAGYRGEYIATNEICMVLREDDYLFTNVSVSYKGKPAEMDNIIVNENGVFIIEVKNYKGVLVGNEWDYEWKKIKEDRYGNTFEKPVRNPLKQVRRQVYILSNYLRTRGGSAWVEGYVLLVEKNSPVRNESVLESQRDIDRVIHTPGRNRLNNRKVAAICHILGNK